MRLPLQISFHGVSHSPEIEELVRQHAQKLDEFFSRIMSCRVVVDMPHRHHEHGNFYHVRIDITVPGKEIAVHREPSEHTMYKDLHVAVRDAFDSARRQLEEHARQQRQDVKAHHPLPHARVASFSPETHYGFLQTPDGREVYFHEDSLIGIGADQLAVGLEVTFEEELGDKGPQASTVKPVGRHHHL